MAYRVNILAFDTSSFVCSIAVFSAGQWHVQDRVANLDDPSGQRHTDYLLSYIDETLHSASCCLSDLNYIVVGVGPGSFTGIRLACTVAQMLSVACGVAVISISSLAAMAQTAFIRHQQTVCHVLLDARMKRFYSGFYRLNTEQHIMVDAIDECMVPVEHFHEYVQQNKLDEHLSVNERVHRAGDGWGVLSLSFLSQEDGVFPSARGLIELMLSRIKTGEVKVSNCVLPNYLLDREILFKVR